MSEHINVSSGEPFPASDAAPWTLGTDGYHLEHDSMGEIRVPTAAVYDYANQADGGKSSHTKLPASGGIHPGARSYQCLRRCGQLRTRYAVAQDNASIADTAQLIADGNYFDPFVVSVFQTGRGTSTNMNANEVIARLAGPGAHPIEHVNRSQSNNDVIPSAIHIAANRQIQNELLLAMDCLRDTFGTKAREFRDVVKLGRTHLQDATPMTLGMNSAAGDLLAPGLYELPLGGTAIGTGVNAPRASLHASDKACYGRLLKKKIAHRPSCVGCDVV